MPRPFDPAADIGGLRFPPKFVQGARALLLAKMPRGIQEDTIIVGWFSSSMEARLPSGQLAAAFESMVRAGALVVQIPEVITGWWYRLDVEALDVWAAHQQLRWEAGRP